MGAILIIIGYIFISGLVQTLGLSFEDNATIFNVFLILSAILGTGFVVIVFHKRLSGKFKDFRVNYKKYVPVLLKNWGIGLIVMCGLNLIINFIANGLAPNEIANREVLGEYPLYSILYVAILAPIAEELLFRENFRSIFKNDRIFLIASAVLFGGMHVIGNVSSWADALYILSYSALGFFFAKTYIETDNIYASIFSHMIHNIFTVEMILLYI